MQNLLVVDENVICNKMRNLEFDYNNLELIGSRANGSCDLNVL